MRQFVKAGLLFCFLVGAAACGDEADSTEQMESNYPMDGVLKFGVNASDYPDDCRQVYEIFIRETLPIEQAGGTAEVPLIDLDAGIYSTEVEMFAVNICENAIGADENNNCGTQLGPAYEEATLGIGIDIEPSEEFPDDFGPLDVRAYMGGKLVATKSNVSGTANIYMEIALQFADNADYSSGRARVEIEGEGKFRAWVRVGKHVRYIDRSCLGVN